MDFEPLWEFYESMPPKDYEVTQEPKAGKLFWFCVLVLVGAGASLFMTFVSRTEMQETKTAHEKEIVGLWRKTSDLNEELRRSRSETERLQKELGELKSATDSLRGRERNDRLRSVLGPLAGKSVTLIGKIGRFPGKGGPGIFCLMPEAQPSAAQPAVFLYTDTTLSSDTLSSFIGKRVAVTGVLKSFPENDFNSLSYDVYFSFAAGQYEVVEQPHVK